MCSEFMWTRLDPGFKLGSGLLCKSHSGAQDARTVEAGSMLFPWQTTGAQ